MLDRVCAAAAEHQLSPSVLTFDPHPRAYFANAQGAPQRVPLQINSLRDKVLKIAGAGIRQIALLPFNQLLAQMSAQAFLEELLLGQLQMRWLLVGPDFRFGHRRGGDVQMLEHFARKHGFELQVLDEITDDQGQRISSSQVRQALQDGHMKAAAALLGQPWRLTGHVLHGKKLGRTLGFPTMNMRVNDRTAVRFGIYVAQVHGLGPKPLPAVASLGRRPTVTDQLGTLLETHVLDANVQAYGKLVRVDLLHHLRDEQKFSDLTTLTAAMQQDRAQASNYFADHGLQDHP